MYDFSKLRGRMVEKGYTIEKLAEFLAISPWALNSKFQNKTQFRRNEIVRIAEALDIQPSEIQSYFFADLLVKNAS